MSKDTKEYYTYDELFDYKPTFWDNVTYYLWYHPKSRLRNWFYEIKYAFQRAVRKYDDRQVFNFDYCFIEETLLKLRALRKTHHGYPTNISNEDWEATLDKMISLLECMQKADTDEPDDLENWKEWHRKTISLKDEFFTLFSKHFYDLWD